MPGATVVVVQKSTAPDGIANPFGGDAHLPEAGDVVASQLDVPLFRPTSDGRRGPHVPGAGEAIAFQLDVPRNLPTTHMMPNSEQVAI